MAETYVLKLGIETPFANGETVDEVALRDYGFSDEEWDAMTEKVQDSYLDDWAEENFWNSGYGYWGEVDRG